MPAGFQCKIIFVYFKLQLKICYETCPKEKGSNTNLAKNMAANMRIYFNPYIYLFVPKLYTRSLIYFIVEKKTMQEQQICHIILSSFDTPVAAHKL